MHDPIMAASDTAPGMLQLLGQFPEATAQDWWMVFWGLTEAVDRGGIWPRNEGGITASMQARLDTIIGHVEAQLKAGRGRPNCRCRQRAPPPQHHNDSAMGGVLAAHPSFQPRATKQEILEWVQ
jgi:hypothetical protein